MLFWVVVLVCKKTTVCWLLLIFVDCCCYLWVVLLVPKTDSCSMMKLSLLFCLFIVVVIVFVRSWVLWCLLARLTAVIGCWSLLLLLLWDNLLWVVVLVSKIDGCLRRGCLWGRGRLWASRPSVRQQWTIARKCPHHQHNPPALLPWGKVGTQQEDWPARLILGRGTWLG